MKKLVAICLLLLAGSVALTRADNTILHSAYEQTVGSQPDFSVRANDAVACNVVQSAEQYKNSFVQNLDLASCIRRAGKVELMEEELGGLVTKPNTFSPSTVIRSSEINANYDTLYNLVNGSLDNANLSASAAISASKINGTAIVSNTTSTQTITATTTISNGSLIVSSTVGYFRVPKMTTVQRTALTADNGAMVYDTTAGQFYIYEGAAWAAISPAAATAVASTSGKGIVEIATGQEAASSTLVGDTNAPLVLSTSLTTSSPTIAGLYVPITRITGKLSQFFIDLTENFAWTGNHTFSGSSITSTPSANNIPLSTASSTLDGWVTKKFAGTSADGALSVTNGTTTINLGNAPVVIKNYSSISITNTGTLAFSNPATTGSIVILKSLGACTLTSSVTAIDASGMGGVGGTAGPSAGAGSGPGGGGGASIINNGNAGTGGSGGGTDATAGQTAQFFFRVTGGAKGSGTAGGVGGITNTSSTVVSTTLPFAKFILTPGSGGGGGARGNAGDAGNGGAGGGAVYLECGSLNFTSTIKANGVNGSSSSDAASGGGGGGGGGFVGILYNTLIANSGSVQTSAGSGGGTGPAGGGGGAGTHAILPNTEFY